MTRRAGLALLLGTILPPAAALQLDSVDVTRHDHSYRLAVRAQLNADPDAVIATLLDAASWPQLNDAILETAITPDNTVRSLTRVCILVFCRRIRQAQRLERRPAGVVMAYTVAGDDSDISAGTVRWQVDGNRAPCRITIDADLTPAFWVPPVIGPYAIRHVLKREIETTLRAIEGRLAAR